MEIKYIWMEDMRMKTMQSMRSRNSIRLTNITVMN